MFVAMLECLLILKHVTTNLVSESSQVSGKMTVEVMVVKLTLFGKAPSKIPAVVDSLAATGRWVTSAGFPLVGHVAQRTGLLNL